MKIARPGPEDGTPTIDRCVAHRCEAHDRTPAFNMNEGGGESECGACIAQDLFEMERFVLWPLLHAYADRLTHHAILRRKLIEARNRLEIASPGAGAFLGDDAIEDAGEAGREWE